MKKTMSICLMAWMLLGTFVSLNAQTTIQRSLYVSARGDDNNNGRSEETPYRTLAKAVETANSGVIKTITVIGTIEERNTINIRQRGADEILITGKPDANAVESAVINTHISVGGEVRFTHIRLTRGIEGPTITLGAGAVVTNTNQDGEGVGVFMGNLKKLIMTDDATITGCRGDGVLGVENVTMSGNASITNNGKRGLVATTVTMSGNAKVSGNKGVGVQCSTLTMSGNAEISGNVVSSDAGGASVESLTMSGNAKIINNTTKGNGGGVFVSMRSFGRSGGATISGNAIISGNTAKQGGGIYFSDSSGILTMEGGEISGNKAEYGAGVYVERGTFNHRGGTITGNEADFIGGGVYVKSGATYTAGGGRVTGNTSGDMGDDNVFRQ